MLCGVRQAYGFWGLCEKFACETLLKAGFGLSSSPRGSLSERETVEVEEEEEEVGRDAKMQRQGKGSRAQRAGMPSQLSVVMGHRPLVADLRNTTIDSRPLLIPPHFFLFPFHPPLSFLIFSFFLLRLTSVYLFPYFCLI